MLRWARWIPRATASARLGERPESAQGPAQRASWTGWPSAPSCESAKPHPTHRRQTSAATPGNQRWVSKHSQCGRHSTPDVHFLACASHPPCSSFVISRWQSRVSAVTPLHVWRVWVRNQPSHEEKISTRVRVLEPVDTTSSTPAKPVAAPSFADAPSCRDAFRGAASHQFSCSSDLHVGSRNRIRSRHLVQVAVLS